MLQFLFFKEIEHYTSDICLLCIFSQFPSSLTSEDTILNLKFLNSHPCFHAIVTCCSRGWPAGLQTLLEHSHAHSWLLLLSCYSFSSFLDLSPSPNHFQHKPPPFHLSGPRQRKVIFSNIPVELSQDWL